MLSLALGLHHLAIQTREQFGPLVEKALPRLQAALGVRRGRGAESRAVSRSQSASLYRHDCVNHSRRLSPRESSKSVASGPPARLRTTRESRSSAPKWRNPADYSPETARPHLQQGAGPALTTATNRSRQTTRWLPIGHRTRTDFSRGTENQGVRCGCSLLGAVPGRDYKLSWA